MKLRNLPQNTRMTHVTSSSLRLLLLAPATAQALSLQAPGQHAQQQERVQAFSLTCFGSARLDCSANSDRTLPNGVATLFNSAFSGANFGSVVLGPIDKRSLKLMPLSRAHGDPELRLAELRRLSKAQIFRLKCLLRLPAKEHNSGKLVTVEDRLLFPGAENASAITRWPMYQTSVCKSDLGQLALNLLQDCSFSIFRMERTVIAQGINKRNNNHFQYMCFGAKISQKGAATSLSTPTLIDIPKLLCKSSKSKLRACNYTPSTCGTRARCH